MKRIIKITFIAAAIAISAGLYAQTPPPPNNENGAPTPENNTPVGGGAPIGSGLAVLLLASAAYGSRKVYQMNKE